MKILLTSDWHIDARTAGVPRFYEIDSYVDELIRVIEEDDINFLFHLGDYFNPGRKLGPLYTATLISIVCRLKSVLEGIVLIAGNHDVIEDSRGPTVLSPLQSIHFDDDVVRVCERTSCFDLVGSFSISVLALPYVARSIDDSENVSDAFGRASNRPDIPLVVIGHRSILGAIVGSETRDMSRGRDIDFPIEKVYGLKPTFIANGHYHRAQIVHLHNMSIVIPGSPQRLTFGERDDKQKGYTVVEINRPGEGFNFHHLQTPYRINMR